MSDRSGELEASYAQLKYNRFGWAAVISFPWTWAEVRLGIGNRHRLMRSGSSGSSTWVQSARR